MTSPRDEGIPNRSQIIPIGTFPHFTVTLQRNTCKPCVTYVEAFRGQEVIESVRTRGGIATARDPLNTCAPRHKWCLNLVEEAGLPGSGTEAGEVCGMSATEVLYGVSLFRNPTRSSSALAGSANLAGSTVSGVSFGEWRISRNKSSSRSEVKANAGV
jgi:hypothetical protein